MARPLHSWRHIHGDYIAASQHVADVRHVKGAAPQVSSGFDDELRPHLYDQFLVDPQVGRQFPYLDSHPIGTSPGPTLHKPDMVVIDLVKSRDSLGFFATQLDIRHV